MEHVSDAVSFNSTDVIIQLTINGYDMALSATHQGLHAHKALYRLYDPSGLPPHLQKQPHTPPDSHLSPLHSQQGSELHPHSL